MSASSLSQRPFDHLFPPQKTPAQKLDDWIREHPSRRKLPPVIIPKKIDKSPTPRAVDPSRLPFFNGSSIPNDCPALKEPVWPNEQTILTNVSIILNTLLEQSNASSLKTQLLNAPIKLYSTLIAIQEGSYAKCLFNVAAFAALFFPHGLIVAGGIDVVAECINGFCIKLFNRAHPPLK